jgi:hypothetical protein
MLFRRFYNCIPNNKRLSFVGNFSNSAFITLRFSSNDQQQQQLPLSQPQRDILAKIENYSLHIRRRRLRLRDVAAMLTPEEQEQIYYFMTEQQQQLQHHVNDETSDSGGGGGGLYELVDRFGYLNGLFLSQDYAGVWYVERTFLEERVRLEQRITEYDATSAFAEAAADPQRFSTTATTTTTTASTSFAAGSQISWEQQQQQQEATSVFNLIRPFLPCGFFIPLTVLASSLPSNVVDQIISKRNPAATNSSSSNTHLHLHNKNHVDSLQAKIPDQQNKHEEKQDPLLKSLFTFLAQMKPQEVDVRVFSQQNLSEVFVRGICENLDFDPAQDMTGEQRNSKYDCAVFAGGLYNALKGKGKVLMTDLPNVLPPDLIFRLPLKQYHAILIFERMPHLFVVNTQQYFVEARCFDSTPPDQQQSSISSLPPPPLQTSLLLKTTPCPSELRFILDNLTQTCPLQVVERELPKHIRNRIKCFFASLTDFVAAHSAYLFLEDQQQQQQQQAILVADDSSSGQYYRGGQKNYNNNNNREQQNLGVLFLNSHRLQQAIQDEQLASLLEYQRQQQRELYGTEMDDEEVHHQDGKGESETISERRKRQRKQRRAGFEIAKFLPDGNGIPIHILRQRLPGELEDLIYKKHPRHFFDMFPDLFTTFVLFNSPTVPFVQHASLPLPVNAVPKVRTEADLVRILAFFSLTPRRLDIVFTYLPAEGRFLLTKRYGGSVLKFLQQDKCKRFFALFQDRFTGEVSAQYVGHYPEEQRESIRRRLIDDSHTMVTRRVD